MSNNGQYAPPAFTVEDAAVDNECNVYGHDFGVSPETDDTCTYCGSPQNSKEEQ